MTVRIQLRLPGVGTSDAEATGSTTRLGRVGSWSLYVTLSRPAIGGDTI